MLANGEAATEVHKATFRELAKLEEDLALVELDSLRQKEYASLEIHQRRSQLFSQIPDFWPGVFEDVPPELDVAFSSKDGPLMRSITSFKVERYQIKSDSEGEPRSLRFTFGFDPSINPYFEDILVVKEVEAVFEKDGPKGYRSVPINLKWTRAAKEEGIHKSVQYAYELYRAERALILSGDKGGARVPIDRLEREGLWEYERLAEEISKQEDDNQYESSFVDFFGYRGVVDDDPYRPDEDDDVDEDDREYLLPVEVFPMGEDTIDALEDLWENALNLYLENHKGNRATGALDGNSSDEEDEEVPELVDTKEALVKDEAAEEEFDGFKDDEDPRPTKKQRRD